MNKSEAFWDRAAGTYDQEEKKDEQTLLRLVEKTRRHLRPGDVVLDFGCGTGRVCNEIAGSVKWVHALDTSANMIRLAKEKATAGKIENIDYEHASIFDERYQPGSFDTILAFYILHLVEDAGRTMERMNGLLKPGGLMISATPCMGEKNPLPGMLISLGGKLGLVPKMHAFKRAELEKIISDANFEMVEKEQLDPRGAQYFIAARKP